MNVKNKERNLLKILRRICEKNGIEMTLLSEDWIIQLSKNGLDRFVFGYNFEINSSTSQMIAQDKCATYAILSKKGVPCVEHHLYMNPTIHRYFEGVGNWKNILTYFEQQNRKIVCKPTRGTGGNDVYVVDNVVDLEIIVQELFAGNRSISLSPFYEIGAEYRVIMLDGMPLFLYSKNIP